MIQLSEVKLAAVIGKKYKFESSMVGQTAGHTKGFKFIGMVKGHDVYHRARQGKQHDYVMTKENDRKIHTHVNLDEKKGAHHVHFIQAKPGVGPGVHHLYHHIITKHGVTLTSNNQSEGGAKVWHKLSQLRGIHVHAVDAKGVGHHVDLSDTRDTHVNPDDVHNAKTSKEAKHLRSIQALRLVAHKS